MAEKDDEMAIAIKNVSEIAVSAYRYDTGDLRNIQSFDDAMDLLGEAPLTADSELGDGFAILDNKDRLVDIATLFLSWSFSKGKFQEEFVSCRVVTVNNDKYVVNDGGTGIREQLREFTDSHGGRTGGLLARHGLRKSEYEYDEVNPKTGEITKKPAVTYYIDTSA